MRNFLPLLVFIALFAVPLRAADVDFATWIEMTIKEAIQHGIRPQTAYLALSDLSFDESVIEKDQKQPEKTSTASNYLERVVSRLRLQRAKSFYSANRVMLNQIGEAYGVQPRFVVALLAVESDFGEVQGDYSIVQSLATLAYEGRRAEYFKGELFNALKILDGRHIRREDMKGSWAGAMGWCQFMPSSFLRYAQDFNGDGLTDIWNSEEDASASAANYLRENGWKKDETWGRKVRLVKPVPEEMIGLKVTRSLQDWQAMGVRTVAGKNLPRGASEASLVLPDGPEGDAYLVYNNFQVLMRWNRSTYFGIAVGMIADSLGR